MGDTDICPTDSYRCGYVALAGRPNVGKSTLLNALIGEHLSIVSRKAQTTRQRVSGILTSERYQILFIDCPGLVEPRYALQESMLWAAGAAIGEADVVAYISDATRPDTMPGDELAEAVRERSIPVIVGVNKTDKVDEETESRLVEEARSSGYETLAISATRGKGLDRFVERLVPMLPESPPLFPAEDSATQSVRFFAAEFVRETCMDLFHDEIPYSITCGVEEFREEEDPVYIGITIYVERESQKGIVIGRGGSAIRKVGETSRLKIEELIDRRVYLDLRVKVMAGWPRRRNRLQQLGFPLPPKPRGGQKRV